MHSLKQLHATAQRVAPVAALYLGLHSQRELVVGTALQANALHLQPYSCLIDLKPFGKVFFKQTQNEGGQWHNHITATLRPGGDFTYGYVLSLLQQGCYAALVFADNTALLLGIDTPLTWTQDLHRTQHEDNVDPLMQLHLHNHSSHAGLPIPATALTNLLGEAPVFDENETEDIIYGGAFKHTIVVQGRWLESCHAAWFGLERVRVEPFNHFSAQVILPSGHASSHYLFLINQNGYSKSPFIIHRY